MPHSRYHLAQVNIARMRAPLDHPIMIDFVAQLDRINTLADATPGFVWRLQSAEGNATAIRAFDDPLILFNMSVWESLEALQDFVYRSGHAGVMQNRQRWFERFDGPYYALWWVAVGHIPTVEEAKARLEHLRRHGESATAFSFLRRFPSPDLEVEESEGTLDAEVPRCPSEPL